MEPSFLDGLRDKFFRTKRLDGFVSEYFNEVKTVLISDRINSFLLELGITQGENLTYEYLGYSIKTKTIKKISGENVLITLRYFINEDDENIVDFIIDDEKIFYKNGDNLDLMVSNINQGQIVKIPMLAVYTLLSNVK